MKVENDPPANLRRFSDEAMQDIKVAVTQGVSRAGRGLQSELRAQVTGAGLGRKLANAWRAQVYPRGEVSAGAAAVVSTKAPKLIAAFDRGGILKSKLGFFLAIPSDAAPRRGIGGKKINPTNFPENVFGPLRFVYRPPSRGPSMLVVDNQRTKKRGGFTRSKSQRALKSGRGLATVPMFFLFPQVRLKKRLNVEAAARKWQGQLPGLIEAAASRLPARR